MANYSYNLGVNHKNKTLTIDLKKLKEETYLSMINDMTGQVYIDRKKNGIVITMAATKVSQTSDYRMFYKYESYVTGFNPPEKYVRWMEYSYDEYGDKDWKWMYYSQNENGMVNVIGTPVSQSQVKPDSITFYVYDKKFNLVYSKSYACTYQEQEDSIVEAHTPEIAGYTKGTAVIDYGSGRNLGKIIIKNADCYDGTNGVYLSCKDFNNNFKNLITQTYQVVAKGKKKNNFSGTNFNEKFDGSNISDKIYTGAGTDTITGNKGNDKIYITGKGNKTINITEGDGHDTIYNSHKATSLKLNLDDFSYDDSSLFYTKKGNNLYISRGYSSDNVQVTILKNFFKKKKNNVFIGDDSKDILSHIKDTDVRLTVTSESKKVKGTGYSEQIYSGRKTKSVNAGDGNNWIVTDTDNKYKMSLSAGKGDDVYYLRKIDKPITISDKGNTDVNSGGGDMLIITDSNYSSDNMFQFYNIKLGKNGSYTTETSLHILSTANNTGTAIKSRKGKLNENVVVKNALKSDGSSGKGWMEYIGFYKNGSATTFSVDYVALEQEVTSWLATNKYNSCADVFKKAGADKVQELINIYMANT